MLEAEELKRNSDPKQPETADKHPNFPTERVGAKPTDPQQLLSGTETRDAVVTGWLGCRRVTMQA